jgi:hypothetical protein
MKPMKLNIQMFAPDVGTISINLYFKDIAESELPESLIFSFDGEQVTIPISGVSMNYVWNYWGSRTFNSITILSEGYLIIPYQVGNGIVDIDIYKNFSFVKKILEDNTINQTTPDFSQAATTDEGMFSALDNNGVSCYFRGAVTNNYVKFANFWWRIVRINGDGSVRLIYQGESATGNGQIGTRAFNTNRNDNAHVGYMYGKAGSSTYEATHANVKNSTIKTVLDDWYESNLSNYSDYIDTEAGFCGDRTPSTSSSSINNSGGTGTTQTFYAGYVRYYGDTSMTPTYRCANSGDLYTVSGANQGNKSLTYPIGLITMDEVWYAGGYTSGSSSYYLYTGQAYWTMSPCYFLSAHANVFRVYSVGNLSATDVRTSHGVRPVINLRGDLFVTGTGTSTDPYEVSLPVVPITNFNGVELTNIYYNGTEISKMYCNGVLVFEKGPTVYKRRIMVGDNLKGLTIYNDMKPGYYSVLDKYYPNKPGNENFIIPSVMAIPFSDAKMSSSNGYVYNVQGNMLNFYDYYNGTENITPSATNSNSDYIVSTVVDTNPSYKHLYIEDPNIRPIQVGDVITENTKFYFNFPDDYDVENNQVDTLIKLDNDNNKRISITGIGGSSSGHTIYFRTSAAFPGVTGDNSAIFFIGSTFINKSSIVVNDIKTLTGKTGYFNGTVTYIDATHSAYQHILVDTTTLGA